MDDPGRGSQTRRRLGLANIGGSEHPTSSASSITGANKSRRIAMDGHDNVSRGENMTKANELNPLDFEADARERQAIPESPEVQALQGRIITLEALHQHVLDLAPDLEIKWSDWRAEADAELSLTLANLGSSPKPIF
jgi:hypothetical protein